jgi:dTDP-4-dehydrorhamnose 3,5-epimerase
VSGPDADERRRDVVIEGVATKRLKVIPDERGRLMECLRSDDELFIKFGQMYVTTTLPSVVKGWHLHHGQWDNVVCVKGMIKLVLCDGRESSPTEGQIDELFIGEHQPLLVRIPPGVWHGWKCVSPEEAYVVNAPTEVYVYEDPDQDELPPDTPEIPYDWGVKLR